MPIGLGRGAAVVLAANLVCLLLIVLAVVLWRAREPMIPAKLRRTLHKRKTDSAVTTPPFGGSLFQATRVLADLDEAVPEERLVAALLLGWTLDGKIRLYESPKKRLVSFGNDMQATLAFSQTSQPAPTGAAGLLYRLLGNWVDEDGAVQESELYNAVRRDHSAAHNYLEQCTIEGWHGLRAGGAIFPEPKQRRFGFLDERRTIYTARGVREAAQLLDYRDGLREASPSGKTPDAVFAMLFGIRQETANASLALTLARTLTGGMRAGDLAGQNPVYSK